MRQWRPQAVPKRGTVSQWTVAGEGEGWRCGAPLARARGACQRRGGGGDGSGSGSGDGRPTFLGRLVLFGSYKTRLLPRGPAPRLSPSLSVADVLRSGAPPRGTPPTTRGVNSYFHGQRRVDLPPIAAIFAPHSLLPRSLSLSLSLSLTRVVAPCSVSLSPLSFSVSRAILFFFTVFLSLSVIVSSLASSLRFLRFTLLHSTSLLVVDVWQISVLLHIAARGASRVVWNYGARRTTIALYSTGGGRRRRRRRSSSFSRSTPVFNRHSVSFFLSFFIPFSLLLCVVGTAGTTGRRRAVLAAASSVCRDDAIGRGG